MEGSPSHGGEPRATRQPPVCGGARGSGWKGERSGGEEGGRGGQGERTIETTERTASIHKRASCREPPCSVHTMPASSGPWPTCNPNARVSALRSAPGAPPAGVCGDADASRSISPAAPKSSVAPQHARTRPPIAAGGADKDKKCQKTTRETRIARNWRSPAHLKGKVAILVLHLPCPGIWSEDHLPARQRLRAWQLRSKGVGFRV